MFWSAEKKIGSYQAYQPSEFDFIELSYYVDLVPVPVVHVP